MKRAWLLLGVSSAVVALDWLTKTLVVSSGQGFRINTGGALSLFEGWVWFYDLASVVLLALIAWWVFSQKKQETGNSSDLGFALIVGGALGNLGDRLTRGGVVDFIKLGPLPSFNVADLAITVGATLFVITFLLKPGKVG